MLDFGFWDIYAFASLPPTAAQDAVQHSIDEIFAQLDILYAYFTQALYPAPTEETSNSTLQAPHPDFQIVIPRLFDPTLMPGWLSERPTPIKPSSVAEQQKNAIYLTERWNSLVENRMGGWLETGPWLDLEVDEATPSAVPEVIQKENEKADDVRAKEASRTDIRHPETSPDTSSRADNTARESSGEERSSENAKMYAEKEIFYFDMPQYLLSLIVNHNLQREGVSDSSGLGKEESPYLSAYEPCVQEGWVGTGGREEEIEGFEEKNGVLVCKEPEKFLFWDAWNLGVKAKKEVGVNIATMVKEGKAVRRRNDE